jgi:two-component system nitrogen regulation response regulator NtrX
MTSNANTILIVEDDGPIRESLRVILEMEGYSILEAENGHQALEILQSGRIPQLIFLDLMMPIMDGTEFYSLFRKNPAWDSIPTIIISAGGNLKEKIQKLGDPAPPVLKKPLDLDSIIATANKYCSAVS